MPIVTSLMDLIVIFANTSIQEELNNLLSINMLDELSLFAHYATFRPDYYR